MAAEIFNFHSVSAIANCCIISRLYVTYSIVASEDKFTTKKTYYLELSFCVRIATVDVPTNIVVQCNHKSHAHLGN